MFKNNDPLVYSLYKSFFFFLYLYCMGITVDEELVQYVKGEWTASIVH